MDYYLPNPQYPQQPAPVEPERPSFWKRFGLRLLLSVGLPLVVLAGVFAFTFLQDKPKEAATNKPTNNSSKQQTEQKPETKQEKSIETVNGLRFANVAATKAVADASTVAQVHAALQSFLDQYDLGLQTAMVEPSSYAKQYSSFSTMGEGDLASFKEYATMLIDEWAKYPKDWVKESKLKKVIIVKDLDVEDTLRAAMPDPIGDALYYDIGYGASLYAREVLHHEYNHLIEYNHHQDYARDDPAWVANNPADFSYRPEGGITAYREDNFVNKEHPLPGFVNTYASYALEEDKAEVYAYLMTSAYYHDLRGWIKTDDKLAKKVTLYKDFIKSVSPTMSGDYFDKINP